mmetsp:Transcript_39640/g.93392  ORF Transcript_39640/g.93392 Transcript_39640/m.93392 type:complete len:809 (-) Transcript_39640:105-2531(-)|eukprot:CAMPEP_0178404646 /NCGR_PEP_ID=MMETSP0689_2-20121128/17993_1 /TAXON_ID=160604 /ORGANISM="Amphidinium massartii, Strain CS-259" /LENGTH=808 /DNA_ID=CAMNT_0020025641 /DNA_START=95 /DNA_END=2521 /DNA_ORIENTATION=-
MALHQSILLLGLLVAALAARPGYDADARESFLQGQAAEERQQANKTKRGTRYDFKLLQLNILADGLADDGFLAPRRHDTENSFFTRVRDTSQMVRGIDKIKIDKKKGETAADKPAMYYGQQHTDKALEEQPLPLANLLHRNEVNLEKEIMGQRIDWSTRVHKIIGLVVEADPDIITFQELDHYDEVAALLARIGYTSRGGIGPDPDILEPYMKTYKQLMEARLKDLDAVLAKWETITKERNEELEAAQKAFDDAEAELNALGSEHVTASDLHLEEKTLAKEQAQARLTTAKQRVKSAKKEGEADFDAVYQGHLRHLESERIAFAPKGNSNARKVWIRNNKLRLDPGQELEKDDEGSAIFWKRGRFMMVPSVGSIRVRQQVLASGEDPKAAVMVLLQTSWDPDSDEYEADDVAKVAVMTTHLASGPEKECRRHFELNSMKEQMYDDLVDQYYPVILSADLNSDMHFDFGNPRMEVKSGDSCLANMKTSCFKLITRPELLAPVLEKEPLDKKSTKFATDETSLEGWGMRSIYSEVGSPKLSTKRPATVVKMRGPGTDQPHKMGDFQLETIDHVFFHPGEDMETSEELLEMKPGSVQTLGPNLGDYSALQMRTYRDMLNLGAASGDEVVNEDGSVWISHAPVRLEDDSDVKEFYKGSGARNYHTMETWDLGYIDVEPVFDRLQEVGEVLEDGVSKYTEIERNKEIVRRQQMVREWTERQKIKADKEKSLKQIVGRMLPSDTHPSDHLAVTAKFSVYAESLTARTKRAFAKRGGTQLHRIKVTEMERSYTSQSERLPDIDVVTDEDDTGHHR